MGAVSLKATLDERLSRITSLSFGQETLAAALALLSAEIGVPIELDGTALRAEGITRNQSFALDLAGGTARDVLLEIVLLAIPDRSATSPRDPRQELVYVVDRRAQRILVTTRAAATSGGHPLPPAFGGP